MARALYADNGGRQRGMKMAAHDQLSGRETLKNQISQLAQIGIAAADPGAGVRRALQAHPLPVPPAGGKQYILAFGKAARAMADAALLAMGQPAARCLIITNPENMPDNCGPDTGIPVEIMPAGHPVPDADGLAAANAVIEMLSALGPDDHLLCLISGGGSAMLPAPAGPLTLADKAAVNQLLLGSGFDITQMNAVRQHLSRLKGGGLTALAAPASVRALILSDVIGDDLRVVASGPTAAPIASRAEVLAMLHAHDLWEKLPARVQEWLASEAPEAQENSADNQLVGSNRLSLEAMLAAGDKGDITLVSDALVCDVKAAAKQIVDAVEAGFVALPDRQKLSFLWGGETTVQITGTGRGGRNQELALRVALEMESRGLGHQLHSPQFDPEHHLNWAFGSIGTDGRDGPTDAAGGIVDAETLQSIRDAGGDVLGLLENNDSYKALDLAGNLVRGKATGTNVADIQIMVCQRR